MVSAGPPVDYLLDWTLPRYETPFLAAPVPPAPPGPAVPDAMKRFTALFSGTWRGDETSPEFAVRLGRAFGYR